MNLRHLDLRTLVVALFAVLVAAGPGRAQEIVLTGTLKAIHARGTILLGVRQEAVPFAFKNKGGQPAGFSVDLCHAIAAEVATAISAAAAGGWCAGVAARVADRVCAGHAGRAAAEACLGRD